MNNFEHLMVDIETMGTKSYSSIISIGALEFDINTGVTGKEFHVGVDLRSCMDAGLKVDPATIQWWMDQSDEARKSINNMDSVPLIEALSMFSDFMKGMNYQIWGNGVRFDLGLIENAYHILKLPIPWKFYNERDVRTLVSFRPEIRAEITHSGVAHDALSDCYHQVEYCSAIWKEMNK